MQICVIGSTLGGPGNVHKALLLLNIFFKYLTVDILCYFYFSKLFYLVFFKFYIVIQFF